MADGPPALPGARIDQSKSRACLGSAELQSQTSDHHRGGARLVASTPAPSHLRRRPPPACALREPHLMIINPRSSYTACFAGHDESESNSVGINRLSEASGPGTGQVE